MSKWGVFYSSVTGNTKMIAEKIAATAGEADLLPVEEMPEDLSAYEVVALGYWLRLGGPDPKMMQYLPRVKHATVILFETHGTDPGSEHAVTAYARAAYLLGEGCQILGTFGCQGPFGFIGVLPFSTILLLFHSQKYSAISPMATMTSMIFHTVLPSPTFAKG